MSDNRPDARGHRWCVVGLASAGSGSDEPGSVEAGPGKPGAVNTVAVVDLADDGSVAARTLIELSALPDYIRARESAAAPRWVWSDTPAWYQKLLESGTRVGRCHDLRLCHAILKRSERVNARDDLTSAAVWATGPGAPIGASTGGLASSDSTLFEMIASPGRSTEAPHDIEAALSEFERQRRVLASADEPGRVGLLLAAESAGALIAAEMTSAGIPWDAEEHDRILTDALGSRPTGDAKPAILQGLADEVRRALGDPAASLESSPKLLRALRAAGIEVSSTSHWELEKHDHAAIEPLLRYKKLSRLLSANGWAWLDEWVRDGRYRPIYVPGGVVTGRWASSGGGALQMPRQLRSALRADPGWVLVSADVAQLEPRVLAAMAGDRAMAEAGRGKDLYSGIVASGIVSTRQEAKIAVLGAMYGATTGDSGRLVPRLRRSYPAAMRLVDGAAAVGENGGVVSTWLGRSSPEPDTEWVKVQSAASLPGATPETEDRARRAAREFGRFTRNFVVQGTAAEWALAWLADLRRRLALIEPLTAAVEAAAPETTGSKTDAPKTDARKTDASTTAAPASRNNLAARSGPSFEARPHLVLFLHDEVIIHTPEAHAPEVAQAVAEAAATAGRLLFGETPVEFPLDIRIAERAAKSSE